MIMGTARENLRIASRTKLSTNNSERNVDVLIKSDDGSTNLFSDIEIKNRIGIGTTTPSAPLHILTTGTSTTLLLESTDADAADAPILELHRNSASPANGHDMGQILWSGEKSDSTKYSITKINAEINTVDSSDRLMINIASSGGSGLQDYEYMRFDGGVRDVIFNEFGYDIDVRIERFG